MMRRFHIERIGRRIASALALVGYLFAVTIGATAHCQAMARATLLQADAVEQVGHEGHTGLHAAAEHHQQPGPDADTSRAPMKAPSDLACGLCQNCSPCGLLSLQPAGEGIHFSYSFLYQVAATSVPDGHVGALPAEPPRT